MSRLFTFSTLLLVLLLPVSEINLVSSYENQDQIQLAQPSEQPSLFNWFSTREKPDKIEERNRDQEEEQQPIKRHSHLNNHLSQQQNQQSQSNLISSAQYLAGTNSLALTGSGSSGGGGSISASNAGQCPILDAQDSVSSLLHTSSNDRVIIDPTTGKRSFDARLVGIFSCLDAETETDSTNDLTLDFRLAKPAIDLAVKTVNAKYPHMHFNVTYRTAPDICIHQQAAGHAADEYYVNGANYFVGPGCSESMASVGQLASYWNVPMCSTGYLPGVITAKFNPLTIMQLSLSVESVGEFILELFQMYKWRHLVIVTDEKHPLHSIIRDGLLEFFHTMYMSSNTHQHQQSTGGSSVLNSPNTSSSFGGQANYDLRNNGAKLSTPNLLGSRSGIKLPNIGSAGNSRANNNKNNQYHHHHQQPYYINITSRNFAYSRNKIIDYEQIMSDASTYSRVMLLLARSSTIGNLLEAAYNQGMSKGQFVFIAHE